MSNEWSRERFKCKWCNMLFKGYVPKGGDGTGFLLPRHNNREGKRCQGSGQLFNAGDGAK